MGMFRKRPLAAALALVLLVSLLTALSALSGAFVNLSEGTLALLFAAVTVLLLAGAAFLAVRLLRDPKHRARRASLLLGTVLVLLGILRSGGFFLFEYTGAQRLCGETVTVTAEVIERDVAASGYTLYRVRAESVTSCGSSESFEPLPAGFCALLLFETAAEYHPRDRLSVTAECVPLSELSPNAAYAVSDGAVLGLLPVELPNEPPEDPANLIVPLSLGAPTAADGQTPAASSPQTEEERPTYAVTVLSRAADRPPNAWERLLRVARDLRLGFAVTLTEELGDAVGALTAAVLTGERSMLGGQIRRDFSRAGIAHLLAISGLHMTVLVGGIALLLRKLKVPRPVVSCVMLVSTCAFLFLTGFSPSACRAGGMLALSALFGFCARTPEPVTSLFLAVAVIVLLDPAAIVDAGLWMSFSSVLGLLILGGSRRRERRGRKEKRPAGVRDRFLRAARAAVRAVFSAVGVSLVASFSVTPVLLATGGEFAVYAPIPNLLTVPLMPLFLALGILFLLLSPLTFFGPAMAALLRIVGGWILSVASFVSDLPRAAVSLRPAYAWVAVALFAVPTVLFTVLPVRARKSCYWNRTAGGPQGGAPAVTPKDRNPSRAPLLLLVPPCAAVLAYLIGFAASAVWFSAKVPLPVTVAEAPRGEMLVLSQNGVGVLFDLSDGRFTGYRNAKNAAAAHGVTEWSEIVLTHYHARTGGSLARFCGESTVRRVCLPPPVTEPDRAVFLSICEQLDALGVPYCLYGYGAEFSVRGAAAVLSLPAYLDRSTEPTAFLTLSSGGTRLTYCTRAVFEGPLCEAAEAAVAESDLLVYGSYGPSPRQVFRIPTGKAPTVLFCGEELLPYLSPISRRAGLRGEWTALGGALPIDLWTPPREFPLPE